MSIHSSQGRELKVTELVCTLLDKLMDRVPDTGEGSSPVVKLF